MKASKRKVRKSQQQRPPLENLIMLGGPKTVQTIRAPDSMIASKRQKKQKKVIEKEQPPKQ